MENIDYQILKIMNNKKDAIGAIELSNHLNYSQATIGRILLKLEKDGLIEKQSNKGRVITVLGERLLKHQLNCDKATKLVFDENNLSKKRLLEILQIRQLVEEYAIKQACINGEKQQFEQLKAIFNNYRQSVLNNDSGDNYDLQLHLLIAKMSKNEMLYQLYELLLMGDNAYKYFSKANKSISVIGLVQHQAIVEALINKDQIKAVEAIRNHLRQVCLDVEKYYQREGE
ncbi:MAG: FCD domain-containing protein [Erysipelotrichaceae bacterium]